MLDIPMDSLPYGGRGQRRSGLSPSSTPSFRRLSRRRLSFLLPPARSSSLSKHHKDFPLACADHKHNVCRHAHVPNSHSLPAHEREREREAYITLTLWKRMRAPWTPIQRVRTRTRVCEVENDRHVHSRARPFAALSRGPPFKTARTMDRRISALFLFATHAWAIWAFRRVSPKYDVINRSIRLGMLIRNLDRSHLAENRVLAR